MLLCSHCFRSDYGVVDKRQIYNTYLATKNITKTGKIAFEIKKKTLKYMPYTILRSEPPTHKPYGIVNYPDFFLTEF